LIFGLYLNLYRSELRQASRIARGIGEAFSKVNSLEMLSALVLDPLEAKFAKERQEAMAKCDDERAAAQGNYGE